MDRKEEIRKMLHDLHISYLKSNPYDEGDPIFYRINYRLAEAFLLSRDEAEGYHNQYHTENHRYVSQGFCDKCSKIVKIIPIIYGVAESELERMKAAELEGRLIIGDISKIRQGIRVAMFGCRVCKSPLAKYGTI
jgi:hypothetical protein